MKITRRGFLAFLFVLVSLVPSWAQAADRYWVGGTGNWSDNTNHWSATSGGAPGAALPTASDNVIFNSASAGASYVVTVDAGATRLALDFTASAPASGNLTLTGSAALTISGSMTLYSGMVWTYTGTMTFNATTTGKTLTFAGTSMFAVVFSGVGGGWTVQDAFTATNVVTLQQGTLDTNGKTCSWLGFTGSNPATRTLTLGASAVSIGTSGWNFGTGASLTFNANTSVITFTATNTTLTTGTSTPATFNEIVLTSAATAFSTSGDLNAAKFTKTGAASKTDILSFGGNVTISGEIIANGNSSVNRLLVRSSARGTSRTVSAATVTMTNVDLQDLTGAGAGSWNLSAISGLSGDCGNNASITFTSPVTNYWIGGTGNWDAVAEWASTSGGSASSGRVPLCQDAARFDANSFNAGSQTVTQNMTRIGSVDWTGVTNTPTWTTSTAASFFGSITLVSGMTLTASTQTYTYEGRGSSTLTSAGKSWAKTLTIDSATGSLTFSDAFTSASSGTSITHTSGTLDAGAFSVSLTGVYVGTTGTLNASGTWTISSASSAIWQMTAGVTVNMGSSTIIANGALVVATEFRTAGKTYGRFENRTTNAFPVNFTGSGFFNDGIYIDASAAARTIQFTAGTTTTVGRIGRLDSTTNTITIGSITATGHTLARASGSPYKTVIENLSVSRSTVTANAFYAPGGTDGGNNSNWVFTQPPGRGIVVH